MVGRVLWWADDLDYSQGTDASMSVHNLEDKLEVFMFAS